MGLMDILNGMQNGPRGARGGSGGGMSPITMALLGLLAYKAVQGFGNPAARDKSTGVGGAAPTGLGLDQILRGGQGGGQAPAGGLGGLLAGLGGGGLGGLLTGGLGDLLEQFQGAGKGDTAKSWVGPGNNQPIAPSELSQVLTAEQIEFLTDRTGLSREELLAGLSEQLPQVVDKLTPDGRLPTADEMSRSV